MLMNPRNLLLCAVKSHTIIIFIAKNSLGYFSEIYQIILRLADLI